MKKLLFGLVTSLFLSSSLQAGVANLSLVSKGNSFSSVHSLTSLTKPVRPSLSLSDKPQVYGEFCKALLKPDDTFEVRSTLVNAGFDYPIGEFGLISANYINYLLVGKSSFDMQYYVNSKEYKLKGDSLSKDGMSAFSASYIYYTEDRDLVLGMNLQRMDLKRVKESETITIVSNDVTRSDSNYDYNHNYYDSSLFGSFKLDDLFRVGFLLSPAVSSKDSSKGDTRKVGHGLTWNFGVGFVQDNWSVEVNTVQGKEHKASRSQKRSGYGVESEFVYSDISFGGGYNQTTYDELKDDGSTYAESIYKALSLSVNIPVEEFRIGIAFDHQRIEFPDSSNSSWFVNSGSVSVTKSF